VRELTGVEKVVLSVTISVCGTPFANSGQFKLRVYPLSVVTDMPADAVPVTPQVADALKPAMPATPLSVATVNDPDFDVEPGVTTSTMFPVENPGLNGSPMTPASPLNWPDEKTPLRLLRTTLPNVQAVWFVFPTAHAGRVCARPAAAPSVKTLRAARKAGTHRLLKREKRFSIAASSVFRKPKDPLAEAVAPGLSAVEIIYPGGSI
jgi:hypothetical protein